MRRTQRIGVHLALLVAIVAFGGCAAEIDVVPDESSAPQTTPGNGADTVDGDQADGGDDADDGDGTPGEVPSPTPTTASGTPPPAESPTATPPAVTDPLAAGLLGTDDLGTVWTVVRVEAVDRELPVADTPACALLGQLNRASPWFAVETELSGPDGRHLVHQIGRAPDVRSAAEVVASVAALPAACPTVATDDGEITVRGGPTVPGLASVVFAFGGAESALLVAHDGDVITAALFDVSGAPVPDEALGGLADELLRGLGRVS